MRRSWRAVTVAVAGALLALATLGACGATESPGAVGAQDQGSFVRSVLQDRTFLFDGYAVATSSVRMPVDDTYRLTVRVCGNQASCGATPTATPTEEPTPTTAPTATADGTPSPDPTPTASASPSLAPGEARVLVGGLISGRLTSDMPGTIALLSSQVQPVLTPEDRATWQWDVTPTSAGTYTLQVHLTVLRAETSQPLIADQVIEIPLQVNQTAAKTAEQAWFGVKEVVGVLSAAGVSLVAVIGFAARWFIKRRRARSAREQEPTSIT